MTSAATSATTRLRLESGPSYDTNVTRVESADRRAGSLLRAVLDLEQGARPTPRTRVGGTYQGGAKHFPDHDGEDALFQRLDLRLGVRVLDRLEARLDAYLKDRTTRSAELPRDYTRLGGGPGLTARLGDTVVGVRGQAERFFYKPDSRLDARAVGGTLHVRHSLGRVVAVVSGTLMQRRFTGPRFESVGLAESGPALESAVEGSNRVDLYSRGGVGLRYVGGWFGRIDYGYEVNDSDSFRDSFRRHSLTVRATLALPAELILSSRATLQQVAYEDPQLISAENLIDDEGRSAVTARLERPLNESWSLVAHGGTWFRPFGAGPDFSRQVFGLGVAYTRDR